MTDSVIPVDPIALAVDVLERGGLVAFPTETVYGLGADASHAQAIEAIYAAKGRPSHHPLIVHVAKPVDLWRWVKTGPQSQAIAQRLIDAFWPGPLTLICQRDPTVQASVSGGQDTIGVRCPSHPVAQALLTAFAQRRGDEPAGIAAPSANRFGQVSPTRRQHVVDEFPDLVAAGMLVLEGGNSAIGIESTIVDVSRVDQGQGITLLRPGGIGAQAIEQIIGEPLRAPNDQAPRVSGSLKAHYSPHTPMQLCDVQTLLTAAASAPGEGQERRVMILRACEVERVPAALQGKTDTAVVAMPDDPLPYAREFYARLRELDQGGFTKLIWAHVPPGHAWDAIRDRLTRAAAAFEG